MKVTALFSFHSISVRPLTLLMAGLKTASAFVVTFFIDWLIYYWQVSICPHWPFFLKEYILHLHLKVILFYIYNSAIASIAEQHPSATICRRCTALCCTRCWVLIFLTFGPGYVIKVWLSTQIKLTRFSSALAINSVVYPLSHMSMLQAPQYSCQKKWKFLEQHSTSSSIFLTKNKKYEIHCTLVQWTVYDIDKLAAAVWVINSLALVS